MEDPVLENWLENADEGTEFDGEEEVGVNDGNERVHEEGLDKFGMLQCDIEKAGNLSADEEEVERLASAGFTEGMQPVPCELKLLKGCTFKDWDKFDEALEDYEAKCGWRFYRIKRIAYYFLGKCRGWDKGDAQACKVELSVRCMKKTGVITVQKAWMIHTCALKIHSFRNGSNKTSWVARQIVNHVRINPTMPINQLNETLRSFHDASSQVWTVQTARVQCREQILGGSRETFHKIPAYIAAIRAADPEGHAFCQTGEERRFARLYIAPASSRHAATFFRPLVGLDGTHTTGKFPMTLLFATCFDAENHIVILAWGVVKVENGNNWCWFLEHLRLSYPGFLRSDMVFISDRDKGLKLGVREAFPNSNHAHCVQHLWTNIKGTIDVSSSVYFKKIVEAKTEREYEKLLADFKPVNEKQEKFVSYVRKIGPEVYARHAFPAPRYGHVTSNVVEIINGAVKPCRVMPALLLSDYIWCYIMEKHCDRAAHARQLPDGEYALTQYANNAMNRLYREGRGLKERRSSEGQSLMLDKDGTWAVNVNEKHCDCMDWKENDFPCVHAVAFISRRGDEPKKYVGQVWHANTQRQAYMVPVPPLSISRLEVGDQICLEPLVPKPKKGRKATKRKPSWGEQQARDSERLVMRQAQKCRRCGKPGHNARSCFVEPPRSVTEGASSSRARYGQAVRTEETLIVGDTTRAQRISSDHEWGVYHVQAVSHRQPMSQEDGAGTGPSQVTQ